MQSNMSDDGKLIELVQIYPNLYDKRRPDFKDISKRNNCWIEIAKKTKCSVEYVQVRWKHLREKYLRLGKKAQTGSGELVPEEAWEYYNNLKWLDAYIKRRNSKSIWSQSETGEEAGVEHEDDDCLQEPHPGLVKIEIEDHNVIERLTSSDLDEDSTLSSLQDPFPSTAKVAAGASLPQANGRCPSKPQAGIIAAEMQNIGSTMKDLFDSVQQRRQAPGSGSQEDLFGQQVAAFLKKCRSPQKKRKFMRDVFSMMIDDEDFV